MAKIVFKWQVVADKIVKCLSEKGFTIFDYSLFSRPNDHLIIEVKSENRINILDILINNGFDMIENDSWCGGNRLGLIIKDFWEEIEIND